MKTIPNATRPASATIKMEVLLNLGRLAPMSDPLFAPDTKGKQHGISTQVEEDTTRETSDNTDIVKILRVDIIKIVPLSDNCTVLIDGNSSSDNAMVVQHRDLVHNWSDILDLSSVTIKPSLLLMYPSNIASLRCNVNSSLKMYSSNNKDYQRDCSIKRSHQLARNNDIMILNEHIHYTDSKQLCFDNQYNYSKRLCFDVDPGNGFCECYGFLTMHPFRKYHQTAYIEPMLDSITDFASCFTLSLVLQVLPSVHTTATNLYCSTIFSDSDHEFHASGVSLFFSDFQQHIAQAPMPWMFTLENLLKREIHSTYPPVCVLFSLASFSVKPL